jgi:hypothetical protein
MTRDFFQQLPSELAQQLLEDIVPTGALPSVILASSYLHKIFEGNKESILSRSVQKHIHRSVLLDAITAVCPLPNRPEVRAETVWKETDSDYDSGERDPYYYRKVRRWLNGIDEMTDLYLQRKFGGYTIGVLPLSISIRLCRLLRSVEGLSKLLTVRAWTAFAEPWSDQNHGAKHDFKPEEEISRPLSYNERTRIQRAFFRFQIYCNLFHGRPQPSYNDWECPTVIEHVRIQIDNLFWPNPPCENEELLCVHQLLSAELEYVFDCVQEKFIAGVSTEEREYLKSMDVGGEKNNDDACSIENDEDLSEDCDDADAEDDDRFSTCDFHFSRCSKEFEDQAIDNLLSRGLNAVFQLLRADAFGTFEQKETIVNSHGHLPSASDAPSTTENGRMTSTSLGPSSVSHPHNLLTMTTSPNPTPHTCGLSTTANPPPSALPSTATSPSAAGPTPSGPPNGSFASAP